MRFFMKKFAVWGLFLFFMIICYGNAFCSPIDKDKTVKNRFASVEQDSTGTISNDEFEMRIVPNPFQTSFKLNLNNLTKQSQDIRLSMVDMKGNEVWSLLVQNVPTAQSSIPILDVSYLAQGAYRFVLKSNDKILTLSVVKML